MSNRLTKRRDSDVIKLMMSDFHVEVPDESSAHCVLVNFSGPEDTPYYGGIFKVQVTMPNDFPYSSPSIGFETRIYHPNIDESSGSVCLNALNECWSPMFGENEIDFVRGGGEGNHFFNYLLIVVLYPFRALDLLNIFTLFLPHLLRYPNASDPLNAEAASLLIRDSAAYNDKVQQWVKNYAQGDTTPPSRKCSRNVLPTNKVKEASSSTHSTVSIGIGEYTECEVSDMDLSDLEV